MWSTNIQGAGVGLRACHYAHILQHGVGRIPWFEAISENFFEPGGRPRAVLERVRAMVPVVLHGVSLGIGDVEPLDREYLEALRRLIQQAQPAWVSDHLCWGRYGGRYAHDLLPLPYTEEALRHVIDRIVQVQDALGQRILLENVSSYVTYADNDMSEWEFVAAVARGADCGILLDVNNICVNAFNHGFSGVEYLDAMPRERVAQLHVAGHSHRGGYLLDSHVGPVPGVVWALYREALARLGPVPTLIEWDEDIPELLRLEEEADKAWVLQQELRHGA